MNEDRRNHNKEYESIDSAIDKGMQKYVNGNIQRLEDKIDQNTADDKQWKFDDDLWKKEVAKKLEEFKPIKTSWDTIINMRIGLLWFASVIVAITTVVGAIIIVSNL